MSRTGFIKEETMVKWMYGQDKIFGREKTYKNA